MITSLNTKVLLGLSLMIASSACGTRGSDRPAAPTAPVRTSAPTQDPNATLMVEASRAEVEKTKNVLVAMGCEFNGKDTECPTPSDYKLGKDLKVALDNYSFALGQLKDQISTESEKTEIHARWTAVQQVIISVKTLINEYSLRDYQEVVVAESRLTNVGYRWKTVGSMTKNGSTAITQLTIDKEFQREHYSKSELRKELNNYIQKLEWFLNIYSDGQNVLKSQILREQNQKLVLAKELAASLN